MGPNQRSPLTVGGSPERGRSSTPPARWLRYTVAIGSVALAWALREALTPTLGPTAMPFITFFPAVTWAAWYGGLGPALLAVGLSSIAANWAFFTPLHALRVDDVYGFVAFPVASGFTIAAVEMMHRARRDLARSRDTMVTTLTSIGDGVVVTDEAGRVAFLNPEAERLTGWRVGEAAGRPLAEVFRIINESSRQTVESPVDRVLREGVVVGLANHTLLVARDGTETPIDDSAAPVRRADGPIEGVVLVFRDVREQRSAAAAQTRLAAIVADSGDAMISKSLDGTILTWNAAAERLFGYRADEIVGKSILTLIPPELHDQEREILERIRSGRPSELLETTRVAKDGRRFPVSLRISPLRDAHGEVVGSSKTLRDLSPLVAARDAIAREKEVLATTLASIGDAVIATDAAGRITFLNPVAQTLTGWIRKDAIGRPLTEVFRIVNETTRAEVENPALRAMREGTVVGLANHTVLLARDGEERPIDDSAAPIRDPAGHIVGSVLVFRDVTERRRTEQERERLRTELAARVEELREADRRKNEFIATLAHELRNPLAPIRNSIALLQVKGPADPELREARAIIARQVSQISRLLEDLLDVNRLARQKLEIRRERVALQTVLASAMETVRPAIQAKRHRVSVAVPPDIVLDADPMRLAQVFSNLLHNAAKFTEEGGEISVRADRDGDSVLVRVRDNGLGIAAENLARLFEMFSQVEQPLDRAQGGVGIGLSLAKGLVELHGGTIAARSEGLGRGSEFVVRLPVAAAGDVSRAPQAEAPLQRAAAPRRILVADDLRDSADSLAMMLRALGHEVSVVYDGAAAVEAAERLRPDVVLLDIAMPRRNGYDACRAIRAQPWGRDLFLIAQTGWGQDVDRRRADEAGFDRHLLKPIDCDALVALLADLPDRAQKA